MSDVFPRWTNRLPGQIIFGLLLIGGVVTAGLNYYFTPKYTRVGFQPTQPVPFSHSVHVKQLGLDCRYSHDAVSYTHPTLPTTPSVYIPVCAAAAKN